MVQCMLSGHKTVDVILGTMSLVSVGPLIASSGHRNQIRDLTITFAFTEWFTGPGRQTTDSIQEPVPAITGIFHLDPSPSFPSSSMASCLAAVAMGTIFWPQGQGSWLGTGRQLLPAGDCRKQGKSALPPTTLFLRCLPPKSKGHQGLQETRWG